MKNIEIYNYYEMVIKGVLGAIMKENIVGTVFDGIKNIKEVIKTATCSSEYGLVIKDINYVLERLHGDFHPIEDYELDMWQEKFSENIEQYELEEYEEIEMIDKFCSVKPCISFEEYKRDKMLQEGLEMFLSSMPVDVAVKFKVDGKNVFMVIYIAE